MFKVFALVTSSGICCSVRRVPKLGENLTCVSLHPRHSKTMWFLYVPFQMFQVHASALTPPVPPPWFPAIFSSTICASSRIPVSRKPSRLRWSTPWILAPSQPGRGWCRMVLAWLSGWVKVHHDKSTQTLYHYYIGNRYWPFQYRKNDDKPWDCGGGAPCSGKTIQNQTAIRCCMGVEPAWNIGLIENWQNWGEQGPTDFQALSKFDLILTS